MFDSVDEGKRIANFADESMFVAQPATDKLPKVYLIDAPSDPLGRLAHMAMMYQGKAPHSLTEISDADREYYIHDMEKNVLGVPSEGVVFYFLLENVSRSFTHQLVRTRIGAGYAQESLRFAVKEDFPVGLPPSLMGTDPAAFDKNYDEYLEMQGYAKVNLDLDDARSREDLGEVEVLAHRMTTIMNDAWDYANRHTNQADKHRHEFEEHNQSTQNLYLKWISEGMPAEDARGILPHWILTKTDMHISLTALMGMAGKRLCTQAQFEHRMVWNGIFSAIREYGNRQVYRTLEPKRINSKIPDPEITETNPALYGLLETGDADGNLAYERSSAWQFEVLLNRFKPICYQTGRCQFRSDFDRYCNIRDRVEANHAIGRPSSQWHEPVDIGMPIVGGSVHIDSGTAEYKIEAIGPHEWLDPNAAIRPDGDWRSEEAKRNIAGRRL